MWWCRPRAERGEYGCDEGVFYGGRSRRTGAEQCVCDSQTGSSAWIRLRPVHPAITAARNDSTLAGTFTDVNLSGCLPATTDPVFGFSAWRYRIDDLEFHLVMSFSFTTNPESRYENAYQHAFILRSVKSSQRHGANGGSNSSGAKRPPTYFPLDGRQQPGSGG